jgi:hypothetical protein
MLRGDDISSPDRWNEITGRALALLAPGAFSSALEAYLAWEPVADLAPTIRQPGGSVFTHRVGDRAVTIDVSTIHAVKGETHDATLVLETFRYDHDLGLAMPFLAHRPPKKKGPRMLDAMKRIFVGATRPKELLCFALHRDRASVEQVEALSALGWSVKQLRAAE